MRRFHLFEIEDLDVCPAWLRNTITEMLNLIHRWFDTASLLADELEAVIDPHQPLTIVDLCSGSGGPMPAAVEQLRQRTGYEQVELLLTDRHPNPEAVTSFGGAPEYLPRWGDAQGPRPALSAACATTSGLPAAATTDLPRWLEYHGQSTDAALAGELGGSRGKVVTMVCCLHHFSPDRARDLLAAAQRRGQSMLIFEMTNNRLPNRWLWWMALPPNFLFGIWVACWLRPMTPWRFVGSFLIPIIPACFAWDGAVSNTRTYSRRDFEALIQPIATPNYQWQEFTRRGRWMDHLVISGRSTGTPAENFDQ